MSFIKDLGKKVGDIAKIAKDSYGPLAKLETGDSQSDMGLLRYPLDVGDPNLYPHTVEFHFYEPIPTGVGGTGRKADAVDQQRESLNAQLRGSAAPKEVSRSNKNLKAYRAANGLPEDIRFKDNLKYKDVIQENLDSWQRRSELTSIVAMYIPRQGPQDTFNINYSDIGLTKATGALGYLLEAGHSIMKSMETDSEGNKTTKVNWAPLLGAAAAGAVSAAKGGLVGNAVGDAPQLSEAAFQIMGGFATNPQMEVIFQGPAFRKFMFQFKMLPRNKKESDEMLKIVKAFKYHSSPEYMNVGGRFFIPPSYVDIIFNYQGRENHRMPMKMSTSVLTAVDMDYGGSTDQFVSFSDGTPLEITMQLQFQELEIMHKELRKQGY